MDFDVKTATGVIMVLAALWMVILVIVLILLQAWVITMLWGWYVVPAFGLQPLAMIHAYGLAILISLFRGHAYQGEDKRPLSAKVGWCLQPLGALLMGWIGTLFM